MSSITPSIGRKVWFWSSITFCEDQDLEVIDVHQAFDATVIFVRSNGNVNLAVTDHVGITAVALNVELRDPDPESDTHEEEGDSGKDAGHSTGYATWMPYQVKQAASA